MRPSSLGGGRILRRTLSVCLSVCLSVRPVRGSSFVVFVYFFYSRTVLRANIQNRKTSVFAYGPASRIYFSARTEGRISYGHLGRTNLFIIYFLHIVVWLFTYLHCIIHCFRYSDSVDRSSTQAGEAGSAMTSSSLWREIVQFDGLMQKFRALNVDATEYACLKGIVLFKTGASALTIGI